MEEKRRVTMAWGVVCIVLGYGMQWASSHMAYSSVQRLSGDPAAFLQISAKASSFGFLTTLGTHLTYFGFALLLMVTYVWLTHPVQAASLPEASKALQGEDR